MSIQLCVRSSRALGTPPEINNCGVNLGTMLLTSSDTAIKEKRYRLCKKHQSNFGKIFGPSFANWYMALLFISIQVAMWWSGWSCPLFFSEARLTLSWSVAAGVSRACATALHYNRPWSPWRQPVPHQAAQCKHPPLKVKQETPWTANEWNALRGSESLLALWELCTPCSGWMTLPCVERIIHTVAMSRGLLTNDPTNIRCIDPVFLKSDAD